MLFARQGKKFDYDLKQLRFAGDLLMELGAGVELATAAVPHLFLPLACAANVVKVVLSSFITHNCYSISMLLLVFDFCFCINHLFYHRMLQQ
jgi:hypothetical protein